MTGGRAEQWASAVEQTVDGFNDTLPPSTMMRLYPREHAAWNGMLDRCRNPGNKDFDCYGGRGISVCPQWTGPKAFGRFMRDLGQCPEGMTLGRLDSTRNFYPENTRWMRREELAASRTNTRRIHLDGETLTGAEWARRAGLPYLQLPTNRIAAGWHPRAAVFGRPGETKADAHARLGVEPTRLGKRGPKPGSEGARRCAETGRANIAKRHKAWKRAEAQRTWDCFAWMVFVAINFRRAHEPIRGAGGRSGDQQGAAVCGSTAA